MEELTRLLNAVSDSYYDFVTAMLKYASKKESRMRILTEYLKENTKATTSDIIFFVSTQEDFFEDAARAEAI